MMVTDSHIGRSDRLRVLVIDNDSEVRQRHAALLHVWGYDPIVAQGIANTLLKDAEQQARACRCQIALVDMHLLDDYDSRDWSGLELVPKLLPTVSIIVSGSGDRKAVVAALKTFAAVNFVGKEDHPEQLHKAIEETAEACGMGHRHTSIHWSDGLTSATIRDLLLSRPCGVPDDEADDVIGRMFAKNKRIALTMITDNPAQSDRVSALRRRSRVFRAMIDDQAAFRIVKLARADKITREIDNYERYVQFSMQGLFRPEKFAEALLWDLGAVAYSYMGTVGLGLPGGPQIFTSFYRDAEDAAHILVPLRHFFGPDTWGHWYKNDVTPLAGSLFEAYDAAWRGDLSREITAWRTHEQQRSFPGQPVALINPTRWLADHVDDSSQVIRPRQAVTHGDLHGDNVFVDAQHAWPIDFERTGPGPILRDFVELTQDILTRLARFSETDLPVFYELAVAVCAPQQPDEPMRATETLQRHAEAYKAFQVVQALQQLAYECTHYDDRRELLWGLLLNSLFVVALLGEEDPRRTRTLLLASVICHRLKRWSRRVWPAPGMPPVDLNRATIPSGQSDRAQEKLEHLGELYDTHKQRLHALELQAAAYGRNVEPAISNEIAELTKKQVELKQQIEALKR